MIDPANITNFNRTPCELEEFAIFAVLVAGKTAKTTAKGLDKLLTSSNYIHSLSPLSFITHLSVTELAVELKYNGIGCYNQKATTLKELANKWLRNEINLNSSLCGDFETIKGIGPKTSRFFIMHSRPNARVAALDTHTLKGLTDHGVLGVPKSTPQNRRTYRNFELAFLTIADKMGVTPAELDLSWWRHYSSNQ